MSKGEQRCASPSNDGNLHQVDRADKNRLRQEAIKGQTRKELFSVQEAAEFLGLSVSTVRRYIRDGRLPAYRVAGERLLRIRRDDLEALLRPVFGEGK